MGHKHQRQLILTVEQRSWGRKLVTTQPSRELHSRSPLQTVLYCKLVTITYRNRKNNL